LHVVVSESTNLEGSSVHVTSGDSGLAGSAAPGATILASALLAIVSKGPDWVSATFNLTISDRGRITIPSSTSAAHTIHSVHGESTWRERASIHIAIICLLGLLACFILCEGNSYKE
jgi:hypothetical protein